MRAKVGRGDRGFAVPMVLFMILGAFSIAMIVAVVSVNAQRGTVRDADSKTALALAEAGVSEALLRYNRVPTTAINKCVVSSGGTIALTPPVGGWCAPVDRWYVAGKLQVLGSPDAGTPRDRLGRRVERGHEAHPGPRGLSLGAGVLRERDRQVPRHDLAQFELGDPCEHCDQRRHHHVEQCQALRQLARWGSGGQSPSPRTPNTTRRSRAPAPAPPSSSRSVCRP